MLESSRKRSLWQRVSASEILMTVGILLLTWIIFGRALANGFLTNWDDTRYILNNEAVQGFSFEHIKSAFSTFYVGNYAPLQIISYMFDYSFWNLNASGFIATNISIHALNGALIYILLSRMGGSPFSALAGSLIFTLHPVQVESVAWISQRKNLLAMLFFLLSFLLYRRYTERKNSSQLYFYAASLVAFVLSLLSKSVAVILPLILIVYDSTYSLGLSMSTKLKRAAPYFLAALLVAAVALVSQSQESGGGRAPYHGGSMLATGLTMLPVLGSYIRMVLWPSGLSAIYDPPVKTHIDSDVLAAFLLLLLLITAGIYLFRRCRREFVWYFTFFAGLLPVSQIIPIVTLMNDRYLYFPMIGVAGLYSCLLDRFSHKSGQFRVGSAVFTGALIICLAVATSLRIPVWRSSLALWNDAVVKSPTSYTAWYGLGEAEHEVGHLEEARAAYARSLAIKPDNPEAVNNLSVVFTDMGETKMARQLLLPLLKSRPDDVGVLLNVGESFMAENEPLEAQRYFAAAAQLVPADPKPLVALGGVALMKADMVRSEEYFTAAIKAGIRPEAIAFYKAGLLARSGRVAEATAALNEAERLGFQDFASMSWDRSFESIRGTTEYKRLIKRK